MNDQSVSKILNNRSHADSFFVEAVIGPRARMPKVAEMSTDSSNAHPCGVHYSSKSNAKSSLGSTGLHNREYNYGPNTAETHRLSVETDGTKRNCSLGTHSTSGTRTHHYEMVSVLIVDMVKYSLLPIDHQAEKVDLLEEVVKRSQYFRDEHARGELILNLTGDGMVLGFRDPISSVECALDIAGALKGADVGLRMGVHVGLGRRRIDLKGSVNLVGDGVNLAQRVMGCGNAGHILLSGDIARVLLSQHSDWCSCLEDFGEREVKHGVKIHLYNLTKDGLGNTAPLKSVTSMTA